MNRERHSAALMGRAPPRESASLWGVPPTDQPIAETRPFAACPPTVLGKRSADSPGPCPQQREMAMRASLTPPVGIADQQRDTPTKTPVRFRTIAANFRC